MKVNGIFIPLKEEITLLYFLKKNGYNPRKVAVEVNGKIVPRATYADIQLVDLDTVEIVHFVGGG
ncbi:sulfur carrier protein ThiS [Clostridium kluyveri]|uniref:sulfur carrier protein ThiS n=1 Tax=Clostridium kluyveri TaxID=1534 RepID=UPI0022486D6C|nr:sulfur carrier protein ThiS [Clostridium kluyveri]UZQ51152.1 sulfur carrier protein ThiS [Clostridium kluyveri]